MTDSWVGRGVGLYRRTATSRSAIVLLVANAIPLVGVAFFGWSLLTILVLYWLENGIVGFWNVPRISMAQGSVVPPGGASAPPPGTAGIAAMGAAMNRGAGVGRAGLALFFTVHYGLFWFVHGIFVFALPAFGDDFGTGGGMSAFGELEWPYVALAAVALFISHGASFVLNYIGGREYLAASPARQMASVYGRVVVLHLTIIFGSMVIAFLGAPIGALLILVALKTTFDLGLHLREHLNARPPLPSGTAPPAA